MFAVLNTVLYWALAPLIALATFGTFAFAVPFVVNAILLLATVRVFARRDPLAKDAPMFRIDGVFATLWLAICLTLAHGALWVALDYIPKHY